MVAPFNYHTLRIVNSLKELYLNISHQINIPAPASSKNHLCIVIYSDIFFSKWNPRNIFSCMVFLSSVLYNFLFVSNCKMISWLVPRQWIPGKDWSLSASLSTCQLGNPKEEEEQKRRMEGWGKCWVRRRKKKNPYDIMHNENCCLPLNTF